MNVNFSAVELSARGWLEHVVDDDPAAAVWTRAASCVEVTETAVLSLLDGTHSRPVSP